MTRNSYFKFFFLTKAVFVHRAVIIGRNNPCHKCLAITIERSDRKVIYIKIPVPFLSTNHIEKSRREILKPTKSCFPVSVYQHIHTL